MVASVFGVIERNTTYGGDLSSIFKEYSFELRSYQQTKTALSSLPAYAGK